MNTHPDNLYCMKVMVESKLKDIHVGGPDNQARCIFLGGSLLMTVQEVLTDVGYRHTIGL